jgi:hypothetical protein
VLINIERKCRRALRAERPEPTRKNENLRGYLNLDNRSRNKNIRAWKNVSTCEEVRSQGFTDSSGVEVFLANPGN